MNDKVNLYRRNGKKVYIKQPNFKELAFVEGLWGHKETMVDIGGTYNFTRDKWDAFYKKMVYPTDGKNFYCLIYTIKDKTIGEVSFHGYDSATKVARINIKIHKDYRGHGYGEEALKLLLEYYFLEFGGETIIDTITTENAKIIFKKIGFKKFGSFRNQESYKITKYDFLNRGSRKKRNVQVLAYDNMDIIDYSIPFKIFKRANEILGEELFEVIGISYDGINNLQNNIQINSESFKDNNLEKEILIVPGGMGALEVLEDEVIVKYILSNYNNCDYVLCFNLGIHFLNKCNIIEGLFIPKSKEFDLNRLENISKHKLVDKNFVDNGKIVISSNIVGNIESCLNIVKKIAGENCVKVLSAEIGVNIK